MILAAVILALILIALLQRETAARGLKSLREEHDFSERVTEPLNPVELILRFSNRSRLPIPFLRYEERLPEGAELTEQTGAERNYRGADPNHRGGAYASGTLWLGHRKSRELHIPLRFENRGRYLLSDLKVYCGDFLGLTEEGRRLETLREIVVFPQAYPQGDWEKLLGDHLGDVSVRRFIFEDPVLTLGFREYTGREPMKMISWTRSAQNNALMVKQYDYTTDPSVTVMLNAEYEGEDKEELFELCCRLARSLCRQLEQQGIPYGFAMNAFPQGAHHPACFLPPGLGQRHFLTVLEYLGRALPETVCSCREMLQKSLEGQGGGKGVFLITPARDEVYRQAEQLARGSYGCFMSSLTAREVKAE